MYLQTSSGVLSTGSKGNRLWAKVAEWRQLHKPGIVTHEVLFSKVPAGGAESLKPCISSTRPVAEAAVAISDVKGKVTRIIHDRIDAMFGCQIFGT